MKIIFGAAGFAKEVDFLLHQLDKTIKVDYFVAVANEIKQIHGTPIINEDELREIIQGFTGEINAYIGIGSPLIRKKVFEAFPPSQSFIYPNAVHPNVILDYRIGRIQMG